MTISLKQKVETHFKFLFGEGFLITSYNNKQEMFQYLELTSAKHNFSIRVEFDRGSYEVEISPIKGNIKPSYSLIRIILFLSGDAEDIKIEPSIENYGIELRRYYNEIEHLFDSGQIWKVKQEIEKIKW
jgi:hypothetical protein